MTESQTQQALDAAIAYAKCYVTQVRGQTSLAEHLIELAEKDPARRHLYGELAQRLVANIRKSQEESERAGKLLEELTRE